MDGRFSSMPIGAGNGNMNSNTGNQMEVLNRTKEVVVDAMSTLSTWGYSAFGQCFSKIRRNSQFDEEHQRSLLLSCHSTETETTNPFQTSDEAMLELRRRVQLTERNSYRHAILSKELAQRRSFQERTHTSSRRERARNLPHTLAQPTVQQFQQQPQMDQQETQKPLSDAQQTLQHMLTHSSSSSVDQDQMNRRMSVEELLSFDVDLPEEQEASFSNHNIHQQNEKESKELRKWLEEIDSSRAVEYIVYAKNFEAQGFVSMQDLAALDEEDVEQAMSEVGISKFAHRARIRKAILRLHSATAA